MDAEEEEVQNFRSLLIEYKFPKCLTDGVSERWKCRIVPHASEEKQMKTYTKRGTPFTVRRKIVSNISIFRQTNDTTTMSPKRVVSLVWCSCLSPNNPAYNLTYSFTPRKHTGMCFTCQRSV